MKTSHKAGGVAVAGVLAAAAAFIAPWEGFFPRTYKDIVQVSTVCFGETDRAAVEEGRRRAFSKAECQTMLAKSLEKYDDGMRRCLKVDLPQSVHVAFLSATYNIGISGFCKSSMARHANAGDLRAACDSLLMWNRAGGRVVKGLVNRRSAERKLCLEGI